MRVEEIMRLVVWVVSIMCLFSAAAFANVKDCNAYLLAPKGHPRR